MPMGLYNSIEINNIDIVKKGKVKLSPFGNLFSNS